MSVKCAALYDENFEVWNHGNTVEGKLGSSLLGHLFNFNTSVLPYAQLLILISFLTPVFTIQKSEYLFPWDTLYYIVFVCYISSDSRFFKYPAWLNNIVCISGDLVCTLLYPFFLQSIPSHSYIFLDPLYARSPQPSILLHIHQLSSDFLFAHNVANVWTSRRSIHESWPGNFSCCLHSHNYQWVEVLVPLQPEFIVQWIKAWAEGGPV